jgi:hypothetical protein
VLYSIGNYTLGHLGHGEIIQDAKAVVTGEKKKKNE